MFSPSTDLEEKKFHGSREPGNPQSQYLVWNWANLLKEQVAEGLGWL